MTRQRYLHDHYLETASWMFLRAVFGSARAAVLVKALPDPLPRYACGVRVRGRG